MIKRTSMSGRRQRIVNNNSGIFTLTIAIVLLGAIFVISFQDQIFAFAMKPQSAMELSNGAPSGPHHNLNILGKKVDFNCDESEGGGVVFTPTFTDALEVMEQQTISFVSNKKSTNEELFAIDPCTEHFSPIQEDGALVHLPSKFDGQTVTFYEVYMAIKGKPENGGSPSKFVFSNPTITQACNIVEAGDTILTTDSDFDDPLVNFNLEKHTNIDGDGIFQSNEIVYLDNGNGVVDGGDTRLANAQLANNGGVPLENGSTPVVGDSDFDDPIIAFAANEKFGDVNPTNGAYDIGEAIYLDFEPDGMVSELDTRLFVPEGSEALSCDSADAVTALGTVTNNGAFVNVEGELERFTPEAEQDENPHGKKVGKGKSRFIDMSGLFRATGAICDATILDTWDLLVDGLLTREDFDAGHDDTDLDAADLTAVGIPGDTAMKIADATADAIAGGGQAPGDAESLDAIINTDAEFAAFLENEFGGTFNCVAFYNAWVFTIADIVEERLDIDNDGATTVQMRFYPRFT